ncbi:MAG: hypothetical protein AAGI44_01545 [Pseudomonadota bacterium]
MGILLGELIQRWSHMFSALARGDNITPTDRLRAEGIMESLAMLEVGASSAAIDQEMNRCFTEEFGRTLDEEFGEDWREFYPFPQIPAVGQRAPVYPSTKD